MPGTAARPIEYLCSQGHYMAHSTTLDQCMVARCPGELKRIGFGAKRYKAEKPADAEVSP